MLCRVAGVALDELASLARAYALLDALLHDGKPQTKAVMAKLLGENPGLRPRARELGPLVARAVKDISGGDLKLQRAELAELDPQLLPAEKTAGTDEEQPGLPPLAGAGEGRGDTRGSPPKGTKWWGLPASPTARPRLSVPSRPWPLAHMSVRQ